MNRKGFTLIELLAVIIVLGLVLVITVPSMIDVYKKSKIKSEERFIESLSKSAGTFIAQNTSELNFTNDGIANKELTLNGENKNYQVTVEKTTISVDDLIDAKLFTKKEFVNPGNKSVECNTDVQIEVYRDSDFTYCHKIKKNSINCLIDYKENDDSYLIDTCSWSR